MTNNDYAIRTQNLSRHFGETKAVDQVTLNVPRGIVFGFLGPNGSGKTTTIRLLLGLLQPTSGEAEVLGYSIHSQSDLIRSHSGAMLEHHGLYERLSAQENLEFFGRIFKLEKSVRQARIQELLNHFGLWERRHERVETWSKGMKQKVVLARTLLHRPTIIFLDEPTSGLDPIAAVSLREDLEKLVKQENVTVFLNTHNLPEAEKLCHQVGVIDKGKLLAVGSLEQLRNRKSNVRINVSGSGFTDPILNLLKDQFKPLSIKPNGRSVEINFKDDLQTSQLIRFLLNEGVQVEEIQKNKISLEDLFVNIIEEQDNVN